MMNENTLSCEKPVHLPPEVLSEVLSWLDVGSLHRFKTVCKEWCYLIEDRTFIQSHMMKSRGHWVFETIMNRYNCDRYRFVDSYFGLILEHHYITHYSRIKNPSTGKTLELPYLGNSVPRGMKMCHVHSSDAVKLVVPCQYHITLRVTKEVFKVLTIGIDIAWREIDIPFPRFASVFLYDTAWVGEVYFMLCSSSTYGVEVICLELGNEQISRIKIPCSFFLGKTGFFTPLAWGESLALASVIEEDDEVHIWVLEDHKEVRWAEQKITVPLKSVGPRDKGKMYIWMFHDNGLLINYAYKEFLLLDVVSGKIRWTHLAPEGQKFAAGYFFVPSLQHPKGD